MYILGINAYHGDAAAAIIRDGKLIAAVEEERGENFELRNSDCGIGQSAKGKGPGAEVKGRRSEVGSP